MHRYIKSTIHIPKVHHSKEINQSSNWKWNKDLHTNVARKADVGTSMWFTHHSHNCNLQNRYKQLTYSYNNRLKKLFTLSVSWQLLTWCWALTYSKRISRMTYPTGCADWFGLKFGYQSAAILWWNSSNDVYQSRLGFESILCWSLSFYSKNRHIGNTLISLCKKSKIFVVVYFDHVKLNK